jgi:heme/copper-type cytochrome/quinol oxidase subunit 1
MPSLVRRFLKTSILFLFLGLLLGLWLEAEKHLLGGAVHPGWWTVHGHLLLVGFVALMILGVALWMFPKPAEGDPRYRPGRMEAVYWLMTLGVVARSVCELLLDGMESRGLHLLAFAGAASEVAGLVLFFANLLPRIRSPREEWARRGDPGA